MSKTKLTKYFRDEDGALYCSKCGAEEGQCDHVATLTKTQEKRFEKFIGKRNYRSIEESDAIEGLIDRVKQHLAKELDIQREEIIEEIENLIKPVQGAEAGRNTAFREVLDLLNKLK